MEELDLSKEAANSTFIGSLVGAGAGGALMARRLRKIDGVTARQRRINTDIQKQELELRDHPSQAARHKMKQLKKRHQVASWFERHPAVGILGGAATAGAVGSRVGHRIGKMRIPPFSILFNTHGLKRKLGLR